MNFRQMADHVKQRQRQKLRDMHRPEDDWTPELYLQRPDELHQLPIPPAAFNNAESKDWLINHAIVPLIRVGQVRVVALVVGAFMLDPSSTAMKLIRARLKADPDASPTKGLPRFQDINGSIEQLWVHVYDAERHEGWAAAITRPQRGAPQLAPFELMGGRADALGGLLADPIKAALR